MSFTQTWHFPLPRTHTGILQSNGTVGVMIWGESNILRVTINRGDYWDHRGGKTWTEDMSYANLRSLLETGDETGLRQIFEQNDIAPGEPVNPSMLPFGRIEFVLPEDCQLISGELNMKSGQVTLQAKGDDRSHEITLNLSMQQPVLHIEFAPGLEVMETRCVTAWDYVGDYLQSISFEPSQLFESNSLSGWTQSRPADPTICLGYQTNDNEVWLGLDYGDSHDDACNTVLNLLSSVIDLGKSSLINDNVNWWAQYWESTPTLSIPNQRLQFLYNYGMYKFAGFTNPTGIPAGLQGAWIEEFQMPPWQADYHFNINVQMCYWPAYRGNLLHHLKPLFDMIVSWFPRLREYARVLVGIDDGFVLPHSVDDRGTCIGGFWAGSIDHGATAWVAEMMYRYYCYSGDTDFLRETAFPFIVGVMRVYEEMLEQKGDQWSLPVSVSPEYRGSKMNAWGINASFQLACIHSLCRNLNHAAEVLELEPQPIWSTILRGLPLATLYGQEIALWEGTPLEESHRHHSHLAGFYPFDIFPLDDTNWHLIYEQTLSQWITKGMGQWSGWAYSWASILHTHFFNASMSELMIETWERLFTNEGYGSLHDLAFFPIRKGRHSSAISGSVMLANLQEHMQTAHGSDVLVGRYIPNTAKQPVERMQMDGSMGITAAIMEMMLHSHANVHYLFPGVPQHWRDVSFSGILATGGFLVSAERRRGEVTHIRIHSKVGGEFKLANPWQERAALIRDEAGNEVSQGDRVLTITALPQQSLSITPG